MILVVPKQKHIKLIFVSISICIDSNWKKKISKNFFIYFPFSSSLLLWSIVQVSDASRYSHAGHPLTNRSSYNGPDQILSVPLSPAINVY